MVNITVPLKKGARFHARPAGVVANLAKRYDSMIMLQTIHGFADASDFLSVMRLTPGPAPSVEILADGPDEKEAAEAVRELLVKLMDDMAALA